MRLIGKKPYKICVSRCLGGCGDMILTTPVYRGLKEKYGKDCHVTVMTSWIYGSGALPELLQHNPYVDTVVRSEPHEFAPSALRWNRKEYKNVPNDHIPHCVKDCDLFVELNVICSIIETRTMPNVTQHRTDIWCEAAHVNPSSKRPVLVLTKAELEEGRAWVEGNLPDDRPRVGCVLKSMSPARDWPHMDRFVMDLHRDNYAVVSIDSMRRVHNDIPAILGKKIRFVAAVMAHLDAVVTPDTGLLHLAGTVGTPVLGIFGSTDGDMRMRHYAGSYTVGRQFACCSPCWYRYGCLSERDPNKHLACMKNIRRDLVHHELECMLERFAPAPEREPLAVA